MSGGGVDPARPPRGSDQGGVAANGRRHKTEGYRAFQMPLHFPWYKRSDYETMPEWKLDCLLQEYGLPTTGDVEQRKNFAMGAFLWPN